MNNKQVYFHIVDPSRGSEFHPVYQYDYIPLAQGLKRMGYSIHSNLNYWKGLNEEYLFNAVPDIKSEDCAINVFSGLCEHYKYPFPDSVMNNKNICKVLIEQNDGLFTPMFSETSKKFDIILHKKVRGRPYPSNCKSAWAFGLSDEIIQLSGLYKTDFDKREDEILINFRYGHPVRNYGTDYIKKLDLRLKLNDRIDEFKFDEYKGTPYVEMLKYSGGRHRPDYMKRLSNSKVCATYGGFFYFDKLLDKSLFSYRLGNYLLAQRSGGSLVNVIRKSGLHLKKTKSIYQWDSWRFWETFACGAVNLNFDLSYYGVELPVQPVNGKHYIGLNFHKGRSHNEQLLNAGDKELKSIADAGKEWAITNYSPDAIAERFIKILGK